MAEIFLLRKNSMKISIDKYKGFDHQNDFYISPLTLIFGNNNAGKSSITRLLPSISQSTRNGLKKIPYYPASLSGKHNLEFFYSDSQRSKLSITIDNYEMEYTFLKLSNTSICVEKLILSCEDFCIQLINDLEDSLEYYSLIHNDRHIDCKVQIIFDSMIPDIVCCDEVAPNENQDIAQHTSKFYRFFKDIKEKCYWIGPLRYLPSSVEYADISIDRLNIDGYGATQILASNYIKKNNVFNTVNDWFVQLFEHSLNIEFIQPSGIDTTLISLSLSPIKNTEIRIPLCDCGMGVSQIFPIFVQLALAYHGLLGSNPIVVIENPELHLHDALHKNLGMIFSALIADSVIPPTLIIETHSENILLSLQIAIAEGRISSEKININWVYKDSEQKSCIKKISFNSNGLLSDDTLNESFSTTSKLAKTLFLAARDHK